MKTEIFKRFLPVSVMTLAIFAAFAFNTAETTEVVTEPGYIFKNKVCQQDGSCSNIGTQICTHNGMTLKRLVGNECLVPLKGTWQAN